MRSYTVFGIKAGGSEVYVTTIYSNEEGKLAHSLMKTQGYWDEIVVRDVLGNKMIHHRLKEVDTAA